MRTIIAILLFLSLGILPINAHIIVRGEVHSSDGEVQPFVTVSLFSSSDSTKLITGAISDMQGKYKLNAVAAGKYHIVVSAVGYNSITENIRLRMPSVGNEVIHDFSIEETSHSLKEVVVKGSHKTNYVDKSVYTFTKEQIKNARHSCDLLGTIEDLSVDMISNKIKKIGGGSVQILINGVNATDNDLKMIPSDKVLKVEYYNIPPARYSTANTVVNVVTKRLDTGWNGGLEVAHAFTTGFGNDDVYIKRVIGNSQFSLDYSLRYRNYANRLISQEYQYEIEKVGYKHMYDSKDKFGYTTNDINLKYSYNKPESHVIQVVLSPNFDTNFGYTTSNIQSVIGQEHKEEIGCEDNHIRTFNPSANLYMSKMLPHNQEIILDLTGTYYHNKQERNKEERVADSQNLLLFDDMHLQNNKKSIIGELAYTKKKGLSILSLGYKTSLSSSNSTISNILSENKDYCYHSGNDSHYLYAEYGNSWKKLLYRIGIGETYVRTYNDNAKFNKWLFTPKIVLAYNLNERQNLQFQITSAPTIPTISQLSDNATFTTRELLRRGNPYLHSSVNYMANLAYGLTLAWVNIRLGGIYSYEKDPISTCYQQENINGKQYIVSLSENAKSMIQYGGMYSINIRPFKTEKLSLRFYGLLVEQQTNSGLTGKYRHLYMPFYYSINIRNGAFGASYKGSIISRQIDGTYLQQDENVSNLQVFYQHKNIRLTAGCYWLFTVSKYHYKTLPNEVLQSSYSSKINDNKSMLTLGFSWNFSTGKKLSINRKIQNTDADKGTF